MDRIELAQDTDRLRWIFRMWDVGGMDRIKLAQDRDNLRLIFRKWDVGV